MLEQTLSAADRLASEGYGFREVIGVLIAVTEGETEMTTDQIAHEARELLKESRTYPVLPPMEVQ